MLSPPGASYVFPLFLCYQLRGFSKQQKLHFFPTAVDKPLQTSNLFHEPQITQLLDRAECRISGLIPRNIDNPEFPCCRRSLVLKAAWCKVHRGYFVHMRPVPGSAWIWFTGIAWKAVLAVHSCTQCLPNWINTCLSGIGADRWDHASPSLTQLSICSWEGSSPDLWQWLLQGSHSKTCSLESCWTHCRTHLTGSALSQPPNSTLILSRERASSAKGQAEFGNGEMRISLWHLLSSVFDINWQLFIWSLIQASGANERSVAVREMW